MRHGETDWNIVRRLQGHEDIPLNAAGLQQARATARALSAGTLDAVVSSDLMRARQTAEAIAVASGYTVTEDTALRERCYGAFEGMVDDEIRRTYPQAYADWRGRVLDARFPAGQRVAETLQEFYDRTTQAIARIGDAYAGQRIAVVAHGGVLECLYRHATKTSIGLKRDFAIHNASISRLAWDGSQLELEEWGSIAHLAPDSRDEITDGG